MLFYSPKGLIILTRQSSLLGSSTKWLQLRLEWITWQLSHIIKSPSVQDDSSTNLSSTSGEYCLSFSITAEYTPFVSLCISSITLVDKFKKGFFVTGWKERGDLFWSLYGFGDASRDWCQSFG